jgi:hypothetical protein
MYVVDGSDKVVGLPDLPQSSVGAPNPVVLAGEHHLTVAYLVQHSDGDVAVVRFTRPCASMFGPPNDEAFSGHPLARRGLEPYGAFEIVDSSWIRGLERMNSVHPRHRPERFSEYRHFILSFHDRTFECIAAGYEVVQATGPITGLIAREAARLGE